jgi:hypothetical protein
MISAVREDTQEHFDPEPTSARERVVMRTALCLECVGEVATLACMRSIAAAHERSQLHACWGDGVAAFASRVVVRAHRWQRAVEAGVRCLASFPLANRAAGSGVVGTKLEWGPRCAPESSPAALNHRNGVPTRR